MRHVSTSGRARAYLGDLAPDERRREMVAAAPARLEGLVLDLSPGGWIAGGGREGLVDGWMEGGGTRRNDGRGEE